MNITLEKIKVEDYEQVRDQILKLINQIWDEKEAINAIHSIERWGNNKNESGTYFYIVKGNEIIGITGYFRIPHEGYYGLRHHGVLQKGTGRLALDLLVKYLKENCSDFEKLVELVPKNSNEIVEKFEEWGFRKVENADLSWEPKRDHYEFMMVRDYEQ